MRATGTARARATDSYLQSKFVEHASCEVYKPSQNRHEPRL